MTCSTGNADDPKLSGIPHNEALGLIKAVEQADLDPGADWYLIDMHWWTNFLQNYESAIASHSQVMAPPLDNSLLLDEQKETLKDGLIDEVSFKLIPKNAFETIQKFFGVRHQKHIITRPVVRGTVLQKEPFVEVYPLKLKIAKFTSRDDVETIYVSYADSFEQLKTKAYDTLGIPRDRRARTLIKVEKGPNEYEIVSEKLNSALDSILRMDMVFLVDDGTQPPRGTPMTLRSDISKQDEVNGNVGAPRRYQGYNPVDAHPPGLCGLQNLGNTCFMNSALQCLSNVPELTEYFVSNAYKDEINAENVLGTKGRLARVYGELIQEMWSGENSAVKPFQFKCVIGQHAPRFNGYAQQDAQELMAFLLDGLHEDLNRIMKKPYIEDRESDGRPDEVVADEAWNDYKRRNDSVIVDLMHGQLKSTVVCPECDKVSIKFDPMCFLSVPVPTKERFGRSPFVFVRSRQENRWAKFSISHSSKTKFGEVATAIRDNLSLSMKPGERLVITTGGPTPIIYQDDEVVPVFQSYLTSQQRVYYVFKCGPGSMIVVNNVLANAYNKGLTVPFLTSMNLPLTRRNILKKIVPQVIACYGEQGASDEDTPMGSAEDSSFTGEGQRSGSHSDAASSSGAGNNVGEPREILVHVNEEPEPFPENMDEEFVVSKPRGPLRIILRWDHHNRFIPLTDADRLVEREVNVVRNDKRLYTLDECIDMFTVREQLDENDSWYCPRCKQHRRAYKKLDLWKLPQILVVHLKRFHYSRFSREKTDTEIKIPVRNFRPQVVANEKHEDAVYDLIAISNHMGGLGSGHYTAKAVNSPTQRWAEFNDSSASFVPPLPDVFPSREAYLLVYRKRREGDPPLNPTVGQKRIGRSPRTKRNTDSEPMEQSDD